jgi:hypothetical protein
MSWDELLEILRTKDIEAVRKAVLALTDAERRALAPRVATLARASSRWWDEDNEFHKFYKSSRRGNLAIKTAVATAGILPASKLAGVLRRIDVDTSNGTAQDAVAGWVIEMLESRDLAENPKLAVELAGRVRDGDTFDGAWFFELALRLARRNPSEPPVHPAFMRLWMRQEKRVLDDVRSHPAWAVLVLQVLEVRDAGQMLDSPHLREVLVQLTMEGLVSRSDLIDACIGALQTTDRKVDLHGLVTLHDQLNPTEEEVGSRVGQYVGLTAGAPAFVAGLAQQRLRALDEAGRLPTPAFAAATTAIMVRPDKGLFRAQLTWLRAALKESPAVREPLIIALAAGLGHPDPGLQKRVLDLITPFAKGLSDLARRELAAAATALAPDLQPLAAGLIDAEIAVAPILPTLEPPAPQPALPLEPITVPEIVAEELAVFYQGYEYWQPVEALPVERILDALVRFAWSDPERLREALAPLLSRLSWLPEGPPPRTTRTESDSDDEYFIAPGILDMIGQCVGSARACADRPESDRHQQELAPEDLPIAAARDREWSPGVVLFHRIAEIAAGIWWAPIPVLLAPPSTADGVLQADELLHRLLLVEAAGVRPWPNDLNQAWLRVPPDDRDRVLPVVQRVAGLSSAQRLIALGAASARVGLDTWTRKVPETVYHYYEAQELRSTVLATLTPAHEHEVPTPWARLWQLPLPGSTFWSNDTPWLTLWSSILPFDRDVMAAHLIRKVPELNREAGTVIRSHAEAAGPIGPASLLLYCYGLDLAGAADRAGTSEALVTVIGRSELDATAFGELLGRLVTDRTVKLNRVVGTLRGVGQAGAWLPLWQILAAVLPSCLPRGDDAPPARSADLLALAVEAAQTCGATGEIAGLDDVAGRRSSSRLRSEARRLQAALTEARS